MARCDWYSIIATDNHHHTRLTALFPGLPRWAGTRKVKTNLDLTEARDSEWQWHQLGHMQVCTSLLTDNHASTPLLSFLQAGCPSCRPTNSVKALKVIRSVELLSRIKKVKVAHARLLSVRFRSLSRSLAVSLANCLAECSVLFFSHPRVGHTMDVLFPFISAIRHSDWLFHRESCPEYKTRIIGSDVAVQFLLILFTFPMEALRSGLVKYLGF